MAIIYNPNKKIFTLHTAHTTYQMQVDPLGYLLDRKSTRLNSSHNA